MNNGKPTLLKELLLWCDFMKQKTAQNENRKKAVKSRLFCIALILIGLYGLFASLTGGMQYINSSDKRVVSADVIRVNHIYEKDDDGDITQEKWKATLRYTVDGKEYTAKATYSTETYRGETVQLEVYKTLNGKYKVAAPNTLGCILSASVVLFGSVNMFAENKGKPRKKQKEINQPTK